MFNNEVLAKYQRLALIVFWGTFFLLTLTAALGQLDRWDLLEQVAMADQLVSTGSLYPDRNGPTPSPVSVYFPGTAVVSSILHVSGIQRYLPEAMLLIACISLISFLVVQVQLAQTLDKRVSTFQGSLVALSVCIFLAPTWWVYAREFKPDTVAFLLGYLALLHLKMLQHNVGTWRLFTAAFLCSLGLLFKQQYVVFILGLSAYCLVYRSKERLLFCSFLGLLTSLLLFTLLIDPNIRFWTVGVLTDDGFLSPMTVLRDNYFTVVNLIFLLLLGLMLWKQDSQALPPWSMLQTTFKNPLPWVIFPSALTAFVSALKVGGNDGNTQLGLILLLPFIIVLAHSIKKEFLTLCALWALSSSMYSIYTGPSDYMKSIQLRDFVKSLPIQDGTVMTGSDVYFATRELLQKSSDIEIFSFWSISLQESLTQEEAYVLGLKQNPQYVVLENQGLISRDTIFSEGKYRIIFENKNGIVAKRNSN